jgi:hypothetical protein
MGEPPWRWSAEKPASEADLQQLRELSPIQLPQTYLELLAGSNGYEGALSVDPLWLQLYPAHEVIDIAQKGTFKEFFPGFFVVGGNGGGEAIAFDTRPGREGRVITFDMTNIDLEESVMDVASNFDELLTKVEPARSNRLQS